MVNETTTVVGGATDIIAVIFIGILAVSVLVTAIFIIRIFIERYKRNSVRFNIIMPDGKIKKERIKNVDKTVKIDGLRYVFDDKAIINYKNTREIFYFYKHPQPIVYDRKKINPNSLSSVDVGNIIDEEYSAKLFKGGMLETKDWIILIALIGVGIVSLYTAYTLSQGIELNPEQVQTIAQTTVNILRGG